MKASTAEKLAGVLKWIVTAVFILLLALMVFVPYLTGIRAMLAWTYSIKPDFSFKAVFEAWKVLFGGGDLWRTVLAWFLLFCGVCAAVILWQARTVLKNLSAGRLFVRGNVTAVVRAGLFCFFIAAACAVRLVINLIIAKTAAPIVSYATFFIPVFVIAGLILLIAGALFARAAELKEDNDLVI